VLPAEEGGRAAGDAAGVKGRGEAEEAGCEALQAAVVGLESPALLCSASDSLAAAASVCCNLLAATGNSATPCRCKCDAFHDSCSCKRIRGKLGAGRKT
jgi:hypothetical protein